MSYVPIYQSVLTHRKTLKLARLLDLDKFSVLGRLIALWTWAMDNATADGSLAGIEPDILADVMGYSGKPSELVEALLSAGFLEVDDENHWRIHDWQEYGGVLLKRKEANAARMRESRKRSRPESVERMDASSPAPARATHVRSTNLTRAQNVRTQRREEERREDTESAEREQSPVHPRVETPTLVASADASRSLLSEPSPKSPPSTKSRPRDPIWDACAEAMDGMPTNQLERGKWAKGIQALRQSGATPEEITLRSQRFRSRFGPEIPLHPIILAQNWSLLASEVTHEHDPHARQRPQSGSRRSAQTRDWDKIKQEYQNPAAS